MHMNIKFFLLCFFSLYNFAVAEPARPPLSKKMAYSDVIYLWGAPLEKQEQESKRQELWYYPKAKVVFYEGRVSTWEDEKLNKVVLEKQELAPPSKTIDSIGTGVDSASVEAILSELMAGNTNYAEQNPAAALPNVPNLINRSPIELTPNFKREN